MPRKRLINRRQQGDLGEASAVEWFVRQGATVSLPLGFSPHYDLLAEVRGIVLRVQVKTATSRFATLAGEERWDVHIATNGGNQSWTGLAKRFDPRAVDLLFVFVGDGRRWVIPAREVESETSVKLGGPKYSEFEIEASSPIDALVYGDQAASRIARNAGERRSRRAGPVCKTGASVLSEFDSHLPHSQSSSASEQVLAVGRTRVGKNHQVTIPKGPFDAYGLAVGDLMRVECNGQGFIKLSRIETTDGMPTPSQPK